MTQKYKSRHKGSEIDNAVDKVDNLATVATTGSYNDLTDKPDIPSGGGADITVDESLSTTSINPVQNKAITAELNKKGTYSKPSGGIPKSDLESDVQESLDKADTALQSYEEQYKGTVTSVKINGSTKNPDADGLVDLGNIVGGEGGSVIVDEALSDTSTNPVQSKAISEVLKNYLPKEGTAANASKLDGAEVGYVFNKRRIPVISPDGVMEVGKYIDFHDGPDAGDFSVRIAAWGDAIRVLAALAIFDGSIKANDYLDAYGISLYETFATKTELGDINAVLDAINGEVI